MSGWHGFDEPPPDYCECPQCNPCVKANMKADLPPCPVTGLGFIGPQESERCDHNEFWTCTTQREAGWILISCDICPAEWQEMLPKFGPEVRDAR